MTNPNPRRRVLVGTATVAVLIAAGLGALFAFTPRVRLPEPLPGRPLLQQDEQLFTDRQVGVQFTPPMYWSMQTRSTESPNEHRSERVIVKYKRLIPGYQVAWIKLSVADAPGDESPAELLKKRKPPEPDWTITKPIEEGLTVAGRPAARITFGGPFDPDQEGIRDFSCEVVAIRRGPRAFFFSGTFVTADPKGQKRGRTALDSLILDADRIVAEK
jgi:hypothetical protein